MLFRSEVSWEKNLVIACGGGIVLNKINIDRLREESVIVNLTASPDVLLGRIWRAGGKRPLLNTPNKASTIQELLAFRKPFYERAADVRIDTSRLDIDSVVEQIISKVKEDESFSI